MRRARVRRAAVLRRVSSLGLDQQNAAVVDLGACGDEHACLCAQCLVVHARRRQKKRRRRVSPEGPSRRAIMTTYEEVELQPSVRRPGTGRRPRITRTDQAAYRESARTGRTRLVFDADGYAVYSPPWFVSVYSKSKALVVSSLCYWWPWYPAPPQGTRDDRARRPGRRRRPFPSPPMMAPPPRRRGRRPLPGPSRAATRRWGTRRRRGIPCEGESARHGDRAAVLLPTRVVSISATAGALRRGARRAAASSEGGRSRRPPESIPILESPRSRRGLAGRVRPSRAMTSRRSLEAGAQRKSGAAPAPRTEPPR